MSQSKEMARIAYHALSDKKGEDIKIIDITGVSVLADYFIIANGNSDSQVNALVDHVEEELQKAGYPLKQREGRPEQAGSCLTSAISSSTYSIKKTAFSMIWNGSGKTEKISVRKILYNK